MMAGVKAKYWAVIGADNSSNWAEIFHLFLPLIHNEKFLTHTSDVIKMGYHIHFAELPDD